MAGLTKHSIVLTIKPEMSTAGEVYASDTTQEGVEFDPGHAIFMPESDYEDMGSPAVVTVTIEPGDRLNEE